MTRSALDPSEVGDWRELFARRSGLAFPDSRLWVLAAAVRDRVAANGGPDSADYLRRLTAGDPVEWELLLARVLNHETSFVRGPTATVIAELLTADGSGRLHGPRVWSAGCSTGQEPYSIAFAWSVAAPGRPITVIGTDVSDSAVRHAVSGRYSLTDLRRSSRDIGPWLVESGPASVRVRPAPAALVEFRRGDLLVPEDDPVERQDAIVCQNVLIYFTDESRERIVSRLCERLAPGGRLFLGPVEAIGVRVPGTRVGRYAGTTYLQRTADTNFHD